MAQFVFSKHPSRMAHQSLPPRPTTGIGPHTHTVWQNLPTEEVQVARNGGDKGTLLQSCQEKAHLVPDPRIMQGHRF